MIKQKPKIKVFIKRINLLEHLLDRKHPIQHRMFVGFIIAFSGVIIAKFTARYQIYSIDILGDGVGYFFHALGASPYIDRMIELFNE